jgi:hemerythrin
MDVLQWESSFDTGFAEVDRQHRHLVKLTNDFGSMLSENQLDDQGVETLYAELVAYTQYHFDEEEVLVKRHQLDQRHADDHAQEHRNFLQEVTLMHQQMTRSEQQNAQSLFEFLMNWLVSHILGSDMSMARQIRSIQSGVSAAEAYHQEERAVDKSTGLLLKSFNNLFRLVSRRNMQLFELNQNLEQRVAERTRSLFEANRKLGELALTDVLTGLPNRRHGMQTLERLWQEALEAELPLACMMIDADGFKAVNDNHGHDAGDQVLCELARQLKYAVRTDDMVCRLGGDEFLILCPKTDAQGAMQVAAQVHDQIRALRVKVPGGEWLGSISVGVAARTADMALPHDLIKLADRGVYAAKDAGRNCFRMLDSQA